MGICLFPVVRVFTKFYVDVSCISSKNKCNSLKNETEAAIATLVASPNNGRLCSLSSPNTPIQVLHDVNLC